MKHGLIIGIFTAITVLLLGSCKEIIAEDITGNTPVLLVPAVNDTVQANPVLFKWEMMEGATKYRLQVVSPGFSNISQFWLDTTVTSTEFSFALDSSEYELKLTALNGGYESQTLGPIKFWVGVSPAAGGNTVVLSSPADGAYANAAFNQFTWNALTGASSYEFSLRKGTNFETGEVIHFQNGISTSTITLPSSIDLTEGTYHWGVKAYLSSGAETVYSKRALSVDTTSPNMPAAPFAPSGSASQVNTNFSWSNGSDNGSIQSPIWSVLEISDDPNFGSVIEEHTVSGSSIAIDLSGYTFGVTYYWRVYNFDEAGNSSYFSPTTNFTMN